MISRSYPSRRDIAAGFASEPKTPTLVPISGAPQQSWVVQTGSEPYEPETQLMSRKRPRRTPALREGRPQPAGADGTPPRAAVWSVDAEELLTRASNEVSGLADRMERFGPLTAKPANPWVADIPMLLKQKGVPAEIRDEILGDGSGTALARSLAAAQIFSAHDHLNAIARCLPHVTVLSLMSLSRVVLEAACTASWLNDSGQEPEEALCRAITLAHGHIANAAKAAEEISAWSALSAEEMQEVVNARTKYEEALAGFDDIRLRFEFGAKLKVPGIVERMELTMEVLREANPSMQLPPDKAMLSFLHGAVHSDPSTFLGMMDTEVEGGMRTASVRSQVQPVLWHAVAPTVMMLKTVAHQWDTNLELAEIEAHATNLLNVIRDAQDMAD